MSSIWFVKEPEALLDYTIDWSDWLAEGDTIASGSFTLLETGLTIEDEIYSDTKATVWLSGGVSGTTYHIVSSVVSVGGRDDERVFDILVRDEPSELSKLLPRLRLHLGDINSQSYRYMDDWLILALKGAIQALERRWDSKYLIDETTDDIVRNPLYIFSFDEPPIVQGMDIQPIILQASIIIKQGSLENSSWNFGSWRDAEISVSNIEGSRAKDSSLQRDWDELNSLLPAATKKLTKSVRIDFNENLIV